MQLTKLLSTIENGVCQAIIPYVCKTICFGVLEKNKGMHAVWTWYSCRDVFHADFPESNHLFVYHKGHSLKKIKLFLSDIEEKLGIDDRSSIFKTVRKSACLIVISEFWQNHMNFSLLTLLLRYGVEYNKIKFDPDAPIKCSMLSETQEALRLFFSGKTEYHGNKDGWYEQFAGISTQNALKYLH
jgi:hypothetical protein